MGFLSITEVLFGILRELRIIRELLIIIIGFLDDSSLDAPSELTVSIKES
jgi:hypothetical protein